MMKRILLIMATIILLPGVALASDISEAMYKGTIYVTNNSTANTSISVPFILNTQHLVENSYLNSSANDCAVRTEGGSDIAFMPGQGSTGNWTVFVPSITDHELLTYLLYTGNVTDGKIRYFPGDGGMNSTDNTDLELGDNFTIEQTAWVNITAIGANLTAKQGAVRTYVSASGNLTSVIYNEASPTGFSDPDTEWNNETNAYDDNTGTFANDSVGGMDWSAPLILTQAATDCDGVRIWADVLDQTTEEINVDAYYSGAWHDVYDGTFNDLAWVSYTLDDVYSVTQMRIYLKNNVGVGKVCKVNEADFFNMNQSITASGLSSGELVVRTWADTSDFHISIGGVESDNMSLAGASVINNSNDWYFMQGIDYMERHQVWVDGVLQQDISWEWDTTFTDQSGNSHDATPTFRATSSDPDVSAELVAWEAVSPAEADPVSIEEEADMVTGAPDAPAQMYDEMNVSHLPLANDLINPLLADAEIPQALFWLPLAFGTAIIAGFGVYAWTKSLLAQVIASMFVMGFWVATGGGIVPAWVFIPFVLEAMAILMMKKTPAPW